MSSFKLLCVFAVSITISHTSQSFNVVVLNDLSMSFEGSIDTCNLHQEMVAEALEIVKSINLTNTTHSALRLSYIEFGHNNDGRFKRTKKQRDDLDIRVITPIVHHNDTSIPYYHSLLPKVCDGIIQKNTVCDETKVNLFEAISEAFNQIETVISDDDSHGFDSYHRVHFVIFSNCKAPQLQSDLICNATDHFGAKFDFSATLVNVGPDFDENGHELYMKCLVKYNIDDIHQLADREKLKSHLKSHLRRRLYEEPSPSPTTDPTTDPTTRPTTSPINDPNDSGCIAKGWSLRQRHRCRCESECTPVSPYCNPIQRVAARLEEELGGESLCYAPFNCCCHCSNCPDIFPVE